MAFWEFSTWNVVIQFSILCIILLIAQILRRKVPFIRKSLLPTAVIGGLIGLVLKSLGVFNGIITNEFLDKITYHAIAIGFVALGLKTAYGNKKVKEKGLATNGLNNGLIIVTSYLVQGIVGLALTIPLGLILFPDLLPGAGALLPMGFGQGPGQANNFGSVFELQHGFFGGQSFALSIASIGFIVACIGGVIYLNIQRKKGKLEINDSIVYQGKVDIEEMKGVQGELPLVDSVDKMTIQIAIVMGTFLLTYLFMFGFDKLLIEPGLLGNFGFNTVRPLIWGFNFIFGTLFAILVRKIVNGARAKKLVNRVYISNFMMNRIAGAVFDFMIIASIMAIDINVLGSLWIPLVIICLAGGAVTFFSLHFISKHFFKGYEIAGFLGMFGMMTGTASTGVALIREADPDFKTPASEDLVSGSVGAMIFGSPFVLLVGIAPDKPILVLILTIAFFIVIQILLWRKYWIAFLRKKGILKPKKSDGE